MRKWPALLVLVLLPSCIRADRTTVRAPDGGWATLVTCNAYEACLEEAAEGCPFGYDVIDRSAQTSVTGFASGGQAFVGTSSQQQMLIKCRQRVAARSE